MNGAKARELRAAARKVVALNEGQGINYPYVYKRMKAMFKIIKKRGYA